MHIYIIYTHLYIYMYIYIYRFIVYVYTYMYIHMRHGRNYLLAAVSLLSLRVPYRFPAFPSVPGVSFFESPLSFATALCIFTISMEHRILNSTEVILTVLHICIIKNKKTHNTYGNCGSTYMFMYSRTIYVFEGICTRIKCAYMHIYIYIYRHKLVFCACKTGWPVWHRDCPSQLYKEGTLDSRTSAQRLATRCACTRARNPESEREWLCTLNTTSEIKP